MCLKDCSRFSYYSKKLVSVKFMWVSHNEEHCGLCRLCNFLMVEKSREIRDYMVLVKGQGKRNAHNSVRKVTFLEWVKEMTRQF